MTVVTAVIAARVVPAVTPAYTLAFLAPQGSLSGSTWRLRAPCAPWLRVIASVGAVHPVIAAVTAVTAVTAVDGVGRCERNNDDDAAQAIRRRPGLGDERRQQLP
jgi:hypothetical protein